MDKGTISAIIIALVALLAGTSCVVPNVQSRQPIRPYTFMIYVDPISGNCAAKDAYGAIRWSSISSTSVFNSAISASTTGETILVKTGTYSLNGSITGTGKDNITLTFENGATLFVSNGMNAPAIILKNCRNWRISGVTINGNAANQAITNGVHGIAIESSRNCRVDGVRIHNVRTFGYVSSICVNVGITNSKITNCGWNGIELGGNCGGEVSTYAMNNEVAYCGDVGISTYGVSTLIQNNYVHDMNGATGYNNAQWGIAVEAGGNNTITGNTVKNCLYGIVIGYGSNIISGNTVLDAGKDGIHIGANDDGNMVTDNSVTGWNKKLQADYGIYIGGDRNTVRNNVLSTTYSHDAMGMYVTGSHNQILGNSINVGANLNYIVDVAGGTENTLAHNTISGGNNGAGSAIVIRTGVTGTIIGENDLRKCANVPLSDSGTYSQITDPTMDPANLGNLGVLTGQIETVTVNDAVTAGQVVFHNSTGWFLASATSTSTMTKEVAVTLQSAASGSACRIMRNGYMRNDAWASMTVGVGIYASTTAGKFTQTPPSGSGNVIYDLGKANGLHTIKFYDSGAWETHN